MIGRLAASVVVGVLALGPASPAFAATPNVTPAPAASTTLFSFSDPRIDEASGIARGITSPGVYYVQNDSGDSARFFALDARTGRVLAVYTVPGATNHDWEDLAVAPDSRGVPSVWLADMGDNGGDRAEVQLYRVDEPRVDTSRRDVAARTGAPDVWRLRYPSGHPNAESLAVSPTGRAYVVTKVPSGHSVVYAVPRSPNASRVQTLSRIGAITFPSYASLIPATLQRLATGAALSRDGTLLVVRTYTDAYVWTVHGGDVAAAVRSTPVHLALPLQEQGEGVCIVGTQLVLDSEGVDTPVIAVPLPAAPVGTSTPATGTAPARTAPSSSRPSTTPPSAAATSRPSVVATTATVGGLAAGVVCLVVATLWWRRRQE